MSIDVYVNLVLFDSDIAVHHQVPHNYPTMSPTLEELDGQIWDEPNCETHLVTACHRLRKKRIEEFSIEDFRILISQDIGLSHLFSSALKILEEDPLAEGDYYPGDLLKALTQGKQAYYESNQASAKHVSDICRRAISRLSAEDQDLIDHFTRFIEAHPN